MDARYLLLARAQWSKVTTRKEMRDETKRESDTRPVMENQDALTSQTEDINGKAIAQQTCLDQGSFSACPSTETRDKLGENCSGDPRCLEPIDGSERLHHAPVCPWGDCDRTEF